MNLKIFCIITTIIFRNYLFGFMDLWIYGFIIYNISHTFDNLFTVITQVYFKKIRSIVFIVDLKNVIYIK